MPRHLDEVISDPSHRNQVYFDPHTKSKLNSIPLVNQANFDP